LIAGILLLSFSLLVHLFVGFARQHSFSKQVNLYQHSHFSEPIGVVCSQDCLGSLTAAHTLQRIDDSVHYLRGGG